MCKSAFTQAHFSFKFVSNVTFAPFANKFDSLSFLSNTFDESIHQILTGSLSAGYMFRLSNLCLKTDGWVKFEGNMKEIFDLVRHTLA